MLAPASTYSCSSAWEPVPPHSSGKKRSMEHLWKRVSGLFHRLSLSSTPSASIASDTSRASTASEPVLDLESAEAWPALDCCDQHPFFLRQQEKQQHLYTFNGAKSPARRPFSHQLSSSASSLPQKKRLRKLSNWEDPDVHYQEPNRLIIPPYSPTYCQPNHFPYSNFYIKLPDGRYMLRYRDGNRNHLRTDIIDARYI
ncbi:hypothetical protein BC940DRAFT_298446 [Gongronella butleri]|nr:hypothetical protein BC940DRAFT_298446 [Gongronella butleri]